ncbi:hypothetical protein [Streptomyces sp. NRRL F-5650]|uniref:DUF7848 domain-containing protein n=1 Tax=Streptomyces sp. NRRL F-5650 TaxID=1463868 RepID=UPI00068EA55C|nr:hypothetical protein [Streptomyces sp. NRRL F-5650]
MTRAVLRFVDYKATSDPAGESVWSAVCVSGEEKDCGATSRELGGEEVAIAWMAEHCAETGHNRFKRSFSDYALVVPK